MTAKMPSPLPGRNGLSAWLIALLAMLVAPLLHAQQAVQFQGIASIVSVTGLPSPTKVSSPAGITVDTAGNLYVADYANSRVVETAPNGGSSSVLSLSGLTLNRPYGIAADSTGDIYIADTLNSRLVEVSGGAAGIVSISGLAPGFNQPHGVATDVFGDVYVADTGNNRIVEIDGGGNVMALPITGLTLNGPYGVAADNAGDVYIADTGNNRIVELDMNGNASVLATNGIVLSHPDNLSVDPAGDLYIADASNNRLVEVTVGGNAYALPVGSPGGVALNQPAGVALDGAGNVYIADTNNNRLVQMQEQGLNFGTQIIGQSTQLNLPYIVTGSVTLATPRVVTQGATGLDFQAGTGTNCTAQSYNAGQVCTVSVVFKPVAPGLRMGAVQMVDSNGNVQSTIYLRGNGQTSQTIAPPSAAAILSVNGVSPAGLADPAAVAADVTGNVYIADTDNDRAIEVSANGQASVLASVGSVGSATGVAVDGAGNVYIADADDGVVVEVSGGVASILNVGDPGGSSLDDPNGMAVDGAGNLYIADGFDDRVVEVTAAGNASELNTGTPGGIGLNEPLAVAVDAKGNILIADEGNDRIVQVSANGTSSVFSTGSISLNAPEAVAFDGSGNVYIADTDNNQIVKVSASGSASILNTGTPGGLPLNLPEGVAADGWGSVYIADTFNGRILKMASQGGGSSGNQSIPSIGLQASAASISAGQSVTLTATVSAPANGDPTPTGTVKFYNGGTQVNSAGLNTSGSSSITVSAASLTLGTNSFTAIYGGDTHYLTATSAPVTVQLTAPTGTLTWTPAVTQEVYGTPLGAGVLNAAIPSGETGTISYSAKSASGTSQSVTAASILSAGSFSLTATFTPTNSSLQSLTKTITFTVTPAPLALKASNATRPYYASNPVFTGTISGAVNGNTFTESFSTTAQQSSSAGTYPIIPAAAGTALANYTVTVTDGTLTITKVASQLKLSASASTVVAGTPVTLTATATSTTPGMPTGTVIFTSGSTQLGQSTLNAQGIATLSVTNLPVGSDTVSANYQGNTNFNSSQAQVGITVSAAASALTWTPAATQEIYGTPLGAGVLNAVIPTGETGTISYSAQIAGGTSQSVTAATVLSAGSFSLTAKFTPTNPSLQSLTKMIAFTVTHAPLALKASNATRAYYASNPVFTGTISGAVNGNTFTESFSTTAQQSSSAGTYPIIPAAAGTALANYTVTVTDGTLTITKVASQLKLSASASTVVAGTPLTLTATATSTTPGIPTGTVIFTSGSTQLGQSTLNAQGVATLSVTNLPVGSDTVSANYQGDTNFISSQAQVGITVTAAASSLVWTPAATQEIYGTPLGAGVLDAAAPSGEAGTISYSAQVAGGAAQPVTATSVLPAGSFALKATFTPTNSSLSSLTKTITFTVTPAPLAVTASNATRAYYASNPTFTGTISGAVNGDSLSESFSTTAQQNSNAGSYPITPAATGTALANYKVTVSDGTLTITQVSSQLSLSASANTIVAGTPVTLTATVGSTTPGMPTGPVTFTSGGTQLGQSTLNAQGVATLSVTNLAVGSDTISATYQGDANFTSSQAQLGVTVTPTGAALTWTPLATQALYGTPLGAGVLNATIPAGGSGTISYTAQAAGVASQPVTIASILPAGVFTLTATFTPTNPSLPSLTKAIGFNVTPAPLTLTAANTSRAYYANNLLFTGTISGAVNGDSFNESFSTTAQQASNAGSYPIIPAASGPALANYTVTVIDGTLTITQAPSQLSLSASANTIVAGAPVTLTATAASNTPGVPTGAVLFTSGATQLGQSPLNAQGVATLSVANLAVGSDTIAATYQGDINFTGATAQVGVTVTASGTGSTGTSGGDPGGPAAPRLFHIESNATNLTVQPGQTSSAMLTLTPVGGYAGAVSFTCLNLPAHTACSFGPSDVTLDGSGKAVHATLTIVTSVIEQSRSHAALLTPLSPEKPGDQLPLLPAIIFWCPGAMLAFASDKTSSRKKRVKSGRNLGRLAILVIVAASFAAMIGCANLSPFTTPAGQQTITVVAAGTGNISQSVQIQLIIP